MNAVADWLFTFLLGWTGNLFNGALRSISSNSAGLNSFFSVIWLPLLLILLLAGTVIDFIVWFIRWRPHYLWRSRALRRLDQKLQNVVPPAPEQTDMPEEYRGQIAQWVAEEEPPLPELWENAPMQEPEPAYAESQPYSQASYDPAAYMPQQEQALESFGVPYQEPIPPEDAPPLPYPMEDIMDVQEEVTEQPLFTPEMQQFYNNYAEPVADDMPSQPVRRRRSNRHQPAEEKPRFASLGGLLGKLAPDDEGVLEGLPPPVSQEKAFNDPVYPDSYPVRQDDIPQ